MWEGEKQWGIGLEHRIDNKCSISGFFAAIEALSLHTTNTNVFHHLLNEVCACCLQVLWLCLVYACISRKLSKFLGLLFLSSACDVFLCCGCVFLFPAVVVIKLLSRWLFTFLFEAQRHGEHRGAPAMQKLEPASRGCRRWHQLLSGTSLRVVATPVSAASLELPARI